MDRVATGLELPVLKSFLFQLVRGIAYCHHLRVLHRSVFISSFACVSSRLLNLGGLPTVCLCSFCLPTAKFRCLLLLDLKSVSLSMNAELVGVSVLALVLVLWCALDQGLEATKLVD